MDAKLILGAPENGAAGAIFVILMLVPPYRFDYETNDRIFMIPYYLADFNISNEVIETNVLAIPDQNA